MRYRKIFLLGDSWTEGQGIGTGEYKTKEPEVANEVSQYRKDNHPIAKFLIDWYDFEVENLALQGNSNTNSLSILQRMIENKKIIKDDIVIIGFTSLMRDYHCFMPPEFSQHKMSWTMTDMLIELEIERPMHNSQDGFFNEYSKNYILNIFDEEYYKYVGFNMIYFLQHYLSAYGIKYYFWNTFETIVETDYKHSKYIDKSKYINFGTNYWDELKEEETILIKKNKKTLLGGGKQLLYTFWERNFMNPKNIVHPNYDGYEYIAKQILNFMKNNPQ